jgi:hypothetical protein
MGTIRTLKGKHLAKAEGSSLDRYQKAVDLAKSRGEPVVLKDHGDWIVTGHGSAKPYFDSDK